MMTGKGSKALTDLESKLDDLLESCQPYPLFLQHDLLPMEFCMDPAEDENRARLLKKFRNLVKKYDGELKFNMSSGGKYAIKLVHFKNYSLLSPDNFLSKYLLDCVQERDILDLNLYRASKSKFDGKVDFTSILRGLCSWEEAIQKDSGEEVSDFSNDETFIPAHTKQQPQTKKVSRKNYSLDEERKILNYIIRSKYFYKVKGNDIWKRMESLKVCGSRSWQSMKERYLKHIIPRIGQFHLSPFMESRILAIFLKEQQMEEMDGTKEQEEGNLELTDGPKYDSHDNGVRELFTDHTSNSSNFEINEDITILKETFDMNENKEQSLKLVKPAKYNSGCNEGESLTSHILSCIHSLFENKSDADVTIKEEPLEFKNDIRIKFCEIKHENNKEPANRPQSLGMKLSGSSLNLNDDLGMEYTNHDTSYSAEWLLIDFQGFESTHIEDSFITLETAHESKFKSINTKQSFPSKQTPNKDENSIGESSKEAIILVSDSRLDNLSSRSSSPRILEISSSLKASLIESSSALNKQETHKKFLFKETEDKIPPTATEMITPRKITENAFPDAGLSNAEPIFIPETPTSIFVRNNTSNSSLSVGAKRNKNKKRAEKKDEDHEDYVSETEGHSHTSCDSSSNISEDIPLQFQIDKRKLSYAEPSSDVESVCIPGSLTQHSLSNEAKENKNKNETEKDEDNKDCVIETKEHSHSSCDNSSNASEDSYRKELSVTKKSTLKQNHEADIEEEDSPPQLPKTSSRQVCDVEESSDDERTEMSFQNLPTNSPVLPSKFGLTNTEDSFVTLETAHESKFKNITTKQNFPSHQASNKGENSIGEPSQEMEGIVLSNCSVDNLGTRCSSPSILERSPSPNSSLTGDSSALNKQETHKKSLVKDTEGKIPTKTSTEMITPKKVTENAFPDVGLSIAEPIVIPETPTGSSVRNNKSESSLLKGAKRNKNKRAEDDDQDTEIERNGMDCDDVSSGSVGRGQTNQMPHRHENLSESTNSSAETVVFAHDGGQAPNLKFKTGSSQDKVCNERGRSVTHSDSLSSFSDDVPQQLSPNRKKPSLRKRVIRKVNHDSDTEDEERLPHSRKRSSRQFRYTKKENSDGKGMDVSSKKHKLKERFPLSTTNSSVPVSKSRCYTEEGDMAILGYIYTHGAYKWVKGRAIWEEMEKREVVPGRSWHSLKERFRKRIFPRINSYKGLPKPVIEMFAKRLPCEGDVEVDLSKNRDGRQKYTLKEDCAILRFITENKRYREITAKTMWVSMSESDKKLRSRSWESLKNRFLKNILPNLHLYELTPGQRAKFELKGPKKITSKPPPYKRMKQRTEASFSDSSSESDDELSDRSNTTTKLTEKGEASTKQTSSSTKDVVVPLEKDTDDYVLHHPEGHSERDKAFSSKKSVEENIVRAKIHRRKLFYDDKIFEKTPIVHITGDDRKKANTAIPFVSTMLKRAEKDKVERNFSGSEQEEEEEDSDSSSRTKLTSKLENSSVKQQCTRMKDDELVDHNEPSASQENVSCQQVRMLDSEKLEENNSIASLGNDETKRLNHTPLSEETPTGVIHSAAIPCVLNSVTTSSLSKKATPSPVSPSRGEPTLLSLASPSKRTYQRRSPSKRASISSPDSPLKRTYLRSSPTRRATSQVSPSKRTYLRSSFSRRTKTYFRSSSSRRALTLPPDSSWKRTSTIPSKQSPSKRASSVSPGLLSKIRGIENRDVRGGRMERGFNPRTSLNTQLKRRKIQESEGRILRSQTDQFVRDHKSSKLQNF